MTHHRRGLADRLGIHRRDGRLVLGRTPYISEEDWKRIEAPGPVLRVLQGLGLAYRPDHTRHRGPFGIFGRTTD
ncbi:hypothetical protein [Nocardioides daeguensis]|uniref:Uncharacterized protein n=1 Tax=Nocardioides daeguensis TaxID=908359 RepID=A0ABP6UVZ3_9ACTN|nr:hypothetical protein [Nocardioides daeguensis]MBV6729175.1 hypothetical protein [Nocardioides daeguensis]MCR1774821.1 hypothetical protein [Nocardioides daeguensis]